MSGHHKQGTSGGGASRAVNSQLFDSWLSRLVLHLPGPWYLPVSLFVVRVSKEVKVKIRLEDYLWILFEHAIPSARLKDSWRSDVFWTLQWFSKILNPWITFIWLLLVPLFIVGKKFKLPSCNSSIGSSFAKITIQTYHSGISSFFNGSQPFTASALLLHTTHTP